MGIPAATAQYYAERQVRAPAVIVWNANAVASSSQKDEVKKKQKAKQPTSWLSGFLGVDKNASKQGAASLSSCQ